MEQIKIIKINYNSIQINDNKVKVLYYSNDGKSIGVIVKGYSHIPYDFGSVIRNDTDIYSDYFDNDSLTIYEDNPLYNYFMIAYLKTEKREYNRYIKKCKDKDYFAKKLADTERRIAEVMSITKSEQPTAEDIGNMLAYSKAKAEEETRRKQEEERKQEEARQREYDFQKSEIAIIIKQRKKYPVIEGEPYVLIIWSEHPAFYEWNDKRSLYLSITACDNILRIIENLDKGFGIGGYKKTKFEIHQPDGNHYEGRYDIGDGDGGIIKHIEGIAKWDLEHPEYGGIEGAKERLNFVQYLKQFIKGA